MKKIKMFIGITAMGAVLVTQTGCFGKFALVRKVYEINNQASSDKFVKSLLTWVFIIVPVYEIAAFADFVLLNTIEFWTGSNPVAMNDDQIEKQIIEQNGEKYRITATKNKFHIEQLTGNNRSKAIDYVFNSEEHAWYLQNEKQSIKIIQYSNNGKEVIAQYFTPNGQSIVMDLDKACERSAVATR